MRKVFLLVLIIGFIVSCGKASEPEYYRVTIINRSGEIIYDESGPWYQVNIQTKMLQGNPFEIISVYSSRIRHSVYSIEDASLVYEIGGHNLQVSRRLVEGGKATE
jgi:hypothetical protein